jgi:phospholipase/carboxylesterase
MHYVTLTPPKKPSIQPVTKIGGEKPPVLVVLHGYGADECDLLPIAEAVAPDFLTISLRAPIRLSQGGYAWYHLNQTESGLHPDDLSRHESEDAVARNLSGIVEREGGDPNEVVFMGFSQGAAICYSLLVTYQLENYGITPRASINMSGYLPRDILAAIKQKHFNGFPFFISHGEFDELVPPMAMNEAEDLLSEHGAIVTTHLYGTGHGVIQETIDDIAEWMAERIKNEELRMKNDG